MAKKLYIQSQVPFVEISVTSAKDAEGKEQTIIVGFKRYDLETAQQKLDSFKDLPDNETNSVIKSEILFIKNAEVKEVDEETYIVSRTIPVKDSRTAQPIEPFWANKDECLSVLVDMYLASTPWKGSLISSFIKTLYNIDFKETEAKNL